MNVRRALAWRAGPRGQFETALCEHLQFRGLAIVKYVNALEILLFVILAKNANVAALSQLRFGFDSGKQRGHEQCRSRSPRVEGGRLMRRQGLEETPLNG